MGIGTTASGISSIAMGVSTNASGNASTAMGIRTTAQAYASVALGRYNLIDGSSGSWEASDPLLVAGNGDDSNNRRNALTLYKNGNLTIGGTLTQDSDIRLKTDIHDLTQPLQKIARLHGIEYKWNPATHPGTVDADSVQLGFLAQEVQTVLPELVKPDSNGYLSVNYVGVIPVLVEAVKDLRQENARLIGELEKKPATGTKFGAIKGAARHQKMILSVCGTLLPGSPGMLRLRSRAVGYGDEGTVSIANDTVRTSPHPVRLWLLSRAVRMEGRRLG